MQQPVVSTSPPEELARVTRLFKALSEPVRVQLVLLQDGERNVTDLTQALHCPRSTVSRHLALLRHTELVRPAGTAPMCSTRWPTLTWPGS